MSELRARVRNAVAVLTLLLNASAARDCYFPDGSLSGDTACFPNLDTSACCGVGYDCTSKGLCNKPDSDYSSIVRGSCTDQSWGSTECPQYCVGTDDGNNLDDANSIWACNDPGWYYCSAEVGDPSCANGGNFYVGMRVWICPASVCFVADCDQVTFKRSSSSRLQAC